MINKGDSYWSKPEDIIREANYISDIRLKCECSGMPLISDGEKLYVANGEEHTALLGVTGAGKSRRAFMPYLITCIQSGEGIIVHDSKAELIAKLRPLLEREGYNVRILNFRDPRASNCYWNPLSKPYKYFHSGEEDKANDMVRELAEMIYIMMRSDDPFWENTGASTFSGVVKLLMRCGTEEECTITNAHKMCNMGNDRYKGSSYLKELVNGDEFKDTDIYTDLSALNQAPNDTRNSIMSVFNQWISVYSSQKGLIDLLSKSDFQVEDLCEEKTAIFVIAPDEKTSLNPIIKCFIQQFYRILIDIADTKYQGRLPVRVNVVLDEFSQLPKIEDMSSMLTASRSRNVRISLGIQSVGQLYDVYEKQASILLENCGLWLYMNSQNIDFLKELSEKLGEYTDYEGVVHKLMTVPELMRFDKNSGETLVLYKRCYPFITRLPDISSYNLDFSIDEPYLYSRRPLKESYRNFDIQDYVRKRDKQNLLLLLNQDSVIEEESFSDYANDEQSEETMFDIDKMIREIDEKIKSLEDEEIQE